MIRGAFRKGRGEGLKRRHGVFLAQATKVSQLYSDLGKEAFNGLTKDAFWPVKNEPAAPFSAHAAASKVRIPLILSARSTGT